MASGSPLTHCRAVWIGLLAACITLLLLVGSAAAGGADWDDEFEAPQQKEFDEKLAAKSTADAAAAEAEAGKSRAERLNDMHKSRGPIFEWKYEGVAIAILVVYVANYIVGNNANKQIARDWESAFCKADGVFAKNFSAIGAEGAGPSKGSLLAREAPDEYKFYASGRRFCEGVMVTLKLKSRNDLFSTAYDMVYHTSDPDLCIVECFMKDECVSQGSVFAIGDKANIATLEGTADDIKRLTAVYTPKDAKGRNATASRTVVGVFLSFPLGLLFFRPQLLRRCSIRFFKKNTAELHFSTRFPPCFVPLSLLFFSPSTHPPSRLAARCARVVHFIHEMKPVNGTEPHINLTGCQSHQSNGVVSGADPVSPGQG